VGWRAADVKRLKQVEQENARLKKVLAERDLELDVMKEINAKNVWSDASRSRTRKHGTALPASETACLATSSQPFGDSARISINLTTATPPHEHSR
jgi:hypothetical protein